MAGLVFLEYLTHFSVKMNLWNQAEERSSSDNSSQSFARNSLLLECFSAIVKVSSVRECLAYF